MVPCGITIMVSGVNVVSKSLETFHKWLNWSSFMTQSFSATQNTFWEVSKISPIMFPCDITIVCCSTPCKCEFCLYFVVNDLILKRKQQKIEKNIRINQPLSEVSLNISFQPPYTMATKTTWSLFPYTLVTDQLNFLGQFFNHFQRSLPFLHNSCFVHKEYWRLSRMMSSHTHWLPFYTLNHTFDYIPLL